MRRRIFLALSAAVTLLLSGCGTSSDNYSASEAPGGYVLFDSDTGNIPYPNDILFDPTTDRLALQISPDESEGSKNLKRQLNTLDGFSTTSPITVGVSTAVDPATIPGNVLLIDTQTGGALVYGTDYIAAYRQGKLAILPLHPLKGSDRYIVILTRGLKTADGRAIEPDYVTSLILGDQPLLNAQGAPTVALDNDPAANLAKCRQIEGIRQHTRQLIQASGLPPAQILDIWSFKTQTIGAVAKAFVDDNPDRSVLALQDTHMTVEYALHQVATPTEGNVSIFAGVLTNVPYYLGVPANPHDPKPLTASFVFDANPPLPDKQADMNIPVLAVAPSANSTCTKPASGWPVVIFQHGITQNRTNLLAIAQSLEKICYAGVAIDLPLHGITDPDNPLYMEYNATTHTGERTFDLDFATFDDNENLVASTPDGKPDPTGQYYINLKSLLTSRDNLRQTTSDLIALKNALSRTSGLDIDASHVAFVGHSLGTMAPMPFLSHQPMESVVLANPGGGIAQLLNHSEEFGPIIRAGLLQAGIAPDTPAYDSFMLATQTILDDADPLNYAVSAASKQKILSFETIPDTVIPNNAQSPLLYGTEPLYRLMGAKNLGDYLPASGPIGLTTDVTATRLLQGTHRSFLKPDVPVATVEMQSEMAAFIQSAGTATQVVYPQIIKK